jgi:hypothetical protein
VAGPLYSLFLFISLLFMDHFLLRHQGWVCIKFVSSAARFSNLLLFSRVPAVNNELRVASRGSIKRRDQMVSSLYWIYLLPSTQQTIGCNGFTTCFDSHESGYVQNLLITWKVIVSVVDYRIDICSVTKGSHTEHL